MKLEPPVLSAVIADMVSVLTPDEMAAHRLRGHIPFEPSCETCQSCKGVHQHRRRKQDKRLVTEIHADFAFISQGIEVGTEEHHKILVLKETFSSSIGAVWCGPNVDDTRTLIIQWLDEFGLRSESVSIQLITDAEVAVSNLIAGCDSRFTFEV